MVQENRRHPEDGCHQSASAFGFAALAELLRRVHSVANLDDLRGEIVTGILDSWGYGLVALSEIRGSLLEYTAVAGSPALQKQLLGHRRHLDAIGSAKQHPRHESKLTISWGAAFCLPLYGSDQELLGCIEVGSSDATRLGDSEATELLAVFAVQAGLALCHAKKRLAIDKRTRLGDTLHAALREVSLEELDRAAAHVVHRVQVEMGVDALWVGCCAEQMDPFCYPQRDCGAASAGAFLDELGRAALQLQTPVLVWRDTPIPEDLAGALGNVEDLAVKLSSFLKDENFAALMIAPIPERDAYAGYVAAMRVSGAAPWDEVEKQAMTDLGVALGRRVVDSRSHQRECRLVHELDNLNSYRRELIATISHELRTPLTSIMGQLEILSESGPRTAGLEAMERNARRLGRLVSNLLTYSHSEAKLSGGLRRFQLATVIKDVAESMIPDADSARIDLEFKVAEVPMTVYGNPQEIATVLRNLVSNAITYTRPGGRVVLSAVVDGDVVTVDCADTGIGISEADQQHLFSAFYRSTNPEALCIPGTGLALGISRRLAQLNGGEISVVSSLGAGSTFTLKLPLRRAGQTPPEPAANRELLMGASSLERAEKSVVSACDS